MTVKINNLDNVGKAVDAAVSAGANDINNLSFQNDVSQQLSDSLTTEAIQDGRHKAEVIAAALGRTLGPVKLFLSAHHKQALWTLVPIVTP